MYDQDKILKDLYDFNPWWQDIHFTGENLHHRRQFNNILKLISPQQIILLYGLRRTGKTTLLLQLIEYLIKTSNILPQRICRFQFEETVIPPTEKDLEQIIRIFVTNLLKEDIHTKERVYFIFDELQFVNGWQAVLKKFYDLNKQFKFFVSGSSSLFIRKTTKESLAGRCFEEKIAPLSFNEFLLINNNTQMKSFQNLFSIEKLLDNSPDYWNDLKLIFARYQDVAVGLFETFIVRGQFPESLSFDDEQLSFRYIKDSVISKVLEYDIPKLYGFRKAVEIGTLFSVLSKETGNLLEYQNLSSEIGISKNTLKEYLTAFIDSYLISILYNDTKKHREISRQLKKSYIASPNITCAVHNLSKSSLIDNPLIGHLVETEVYNRLNEEYSGISFYNHRGKEVDMLISCEDQIIPIEVKYKNIIRKKDTDIICNYLEKNSNEFGIIFTKNTLEQITLSDKLIYLIPVWML